jgi:hypothetical protein
VAEKLFALFPLHKQIEKHGSMPDSLFPKSDSRAGNTSSELKWPEREPDHSHNSSTEFKNKCSYVCTSRYGFIACTGTTLSLPLPHSINTQFNENPTAIPQLLCVNEWPVSWEANSSSARQDKTYWISIVLLISHLRLCFPSGVFRSGHPTTTLYTPLVSPMHATCPAHFMKDWIE